MVTPKAVFFIFNQIGADQLATSPDLLSDIDCVMSVLPGISLDGISGNIETMTLEQALEHFEISLRDISVSASDYSSALLDAAATSEALRKFSEYGAEGVRLALLNHVALLTQNAFAFEHVFSALVASGLRSARCFPFYGHFRMVERLDIKTLLHVELSFGPHLVHLCHEASVDLVRVGSGSRLGGVEHTLRTALLLGYKFATLVSRSRAARINGLLAPRNMAFCVRGRTEIAAAEPLLRSRAKQGCRDVMLVDDVIKSPDCTAAAQKSAFEWQPLHAFSTPSEVFRTVLGAVFQRGTVARLALREDPQRLSPWSFMGRPDVALEVLKTAFFSILELLVYRLQLQRSLAAIAPECIVSFDTVDRWGALQGELARTMNIRSVIVQNTAADDIVYPLPLSMDHMVVGNNRLRDVFLASGANPDRVHAFGLPLQDDVLKAGNLRIGELHQRAAQDTAHPLRIMVVTQPFVQEFNYNLVMVDELCAAIECLRFPIELVLKPHPREAVGAYDNLVARLSTLGHSVSQFTGPFEEALDRADIVLSRTSTSLEFAALGGVPGIAHLKDYPADIVDRLDYLRDSVTSKSFSTEELRDLLRHFAPETRAATFEQYTERRDDFLAALFPGRGLATQRVATLIETGFPPC